MSTLPLPPGRSSQQVLAHIPKGMPTCTYVAALDIYPHQIPFLQGAAALQETLGWLHASTLNISPYCCRVLQPSKNPFVDTLRAVINDVKWFLFLLMLTMWGFCVSFYILFRRDQKKEASPADLLFPTHSFDTLVAHSLKRHHFFDVLNLPKRSEVNFATRALSLVGMQILPKTGSQLLGRNWQP